MKAETLIQIKIASWLRKKEVFFFSVPNDFTWRKKDFVWAFNMGMLAGTPDLFLPKYRLFLEVKRLKGKISPEQIKFKEKALKCGYEVLFPRSLNEVKSIYKKYEGKYRRSYYSKAIATRRYIKSRQRMEKTNSYN